MSIAGGYDPAMPGSLPPARLAEEVAESEAAERASSSTGAGKVDGGDDLAEGAAAVERINDPMNAEILRDLAHRTD